MYISKKSTGDLPVKEVFPNWIWRNLSNLKEDDVSQEHFEMTMSTSQHKVGTTKVLSSPVGVVI